MDTKVFSKFKKNIIYSIVVISVLSITTNKVASQTAEVAKPKVFYHLVDSVGIGNGKGLKLYVASSTGDSKTFNRIYGYLYDPAAELSTGKVKRPVEVYRFDVDNNKIAMEFLDEKGNVITLAPSPKIQAFLEGKGTVPMADDSTIKINSTKTKLQ